MKKDNLKLIVLESGKHLGTLVNEELKLIRNNPDGFIIEANNPTFANSELNAVIEESVRGSDLFILADVGHHDIKYNYYGEENRKSFNDHFMEILTMINASASTANRTWVIMPLLYASRQHKREKREALTCAMSLSILEHLGTKGIITFDVHDPAVRSALNRTSFDTIYTTNTMLDHLLDTENIDFNKLLVVNPDAGATKRAHYFGRILEAPVGGFRKVRDTSKVVNGTCLIESHEYTGNVPLKDKNIIVVDDMIASGQSMIDVAKAAKDEGANKVYLFSTFGLFSNGLSSVKLFDEAFEKKLIDKVYITNLSYIPEYIKQKDWLEVVNCAPTLAQIISALHDDESISQFMNGAEKITAKIKEKKLIHQKD